MAISGHFRARFVAIGLVVCLVGGTVGLEATAAHMTSEIARADRLMPAHGVHGPAHSAHGEHDEAPPDVS